MLNVVAVLPWLGLALRPAHDGGRAPREGQPGAVVRSDSPDGPGAASQGRLGGGPPPPHTGPVRVWRSPTAWALALVFGCTSLNTYGMFAWIPSVFADAGLPPQEAGLWLAPGAAPSLWSALACLGPLVTGWLHDATGEWTALFAFLGATLAVLAAAGWVISRRGFVDDDEGVLAAR
ncbi:MFS transporter [Sinomonas mesophila]|uniref:MFS transporter n=1 Tax=Sinomonas mesophila TaxID=1531955 RepID=UPI000987AC40|nr:MFS transporter [Sinomonas mesophila]